MFKCLKQLTSLVAMVAILFVFTTETMAAKKSKTLKNTMKKGFVRCGVSQGLPCRGSFSAAAKEAMAVSTIASQIRITRCKCIENSLLMSGGFTVLYRCCPVTH